MPEAINVLEQAWSIAYKEVGKTGDDKVPTIDMITGTCWGAVSKRRLGLGRVWLRCCAGQRISLA